MSYPSLYREMLGKEGLGQRDRSINAFKREVRSLARGNPAYKPIEVNGELRYVIINSKDDYTIKEVVSMPGDYIPMGAYVTFRDQTWLVQNTDIDDEIYSKAMMYLCDCELKWKDKDGNVYSYPGVSEDATKYSEGVEHTQYMRISEFQLKVKVHVDDISSTIWRDMRFIIDVDDYVDDVVEHEHRPYVFRCTRRNIVTGMIEGEGYVEITLVQDQWIEGKDDYEEMLAAQPWELKEPYIGDSADTAEDDGKWL